MKMIGTVRLTCWSIAIMMIMALATASVGLASDSDKSGYYYPKPSKPYFVYAKPSLYGHDLVVYFKEVKLPFKKPVYYQLTAKVTVVVQCVNPAGKYPPGQRKYIDFDVKAIDKKDPYYDKKNPKYNFVVEDKIFVKLDHELKKLGHICPNPKWTPKIVAVKYYDIKLYDLTYKVPAKVEPSEVHWGQVYY